jgi:hypothetical protein
MLDCTSMTSSRGASSRNDDRLHQRGQDRGGVGHGGSGLPTHHITPSVGFDQDDWRAGPGSNRAVVPIGDSRASLT